MIPIIIPPIPLLKYAHDHPMHLLLVDLCYDPRYAAFYAEARERGAYLILDNNAHEHGKGTSIRQVVHWGETLDAQEIVIPDTLEDANATVHQAFQAFQYLYEHDRMPGQTYHPNLMIVPQGRNVGEFEWCLTQQIKAYKQYAPMFRTPPALTIGVSKDYEIWPGGLIRLLVDVILPHALEVGAQVHLLGWGRDAWRYLEIATNYRFIRSVDSAKPFVYALAGQRTEPGLALTYPRRPPDYFTRDYQYYANPEYRVILQFNLGVYQQLMRGHGDAIRSYRSWKTHKPAYAHPSVDDEVFS